MKPYNIYTYKHNKMKLNEIKRMQQLAGLINESQLNENQVPDEVAMTIFLEELGMKVKDPIFQGVIKSGNVEEALDLIDDMVDLERSYSQSDIIAAMEAAQFSQDMIDRIIDEHPIVSRLEKG